MSTPFPGQPFPGGPAPRPGGPQPFGAGPVGPTAGTDAKPKKAKKAKAPKAGSSGGGSRLMLIVGLILALLTGLLLIGVAAGDGDGPATRLVVVASRDIGPLTPLSPDMFTALPATEAMLAGVNGGEIPTDPASDAPEPGATEGPAAPATAVAGQYIIVSSVEDIAELELFAGDRFVRYPIPAGAPLFETYLEDPDAARADLGPDERLITIRAGVARAFAGRIVAGDHVDVVATDGEIAAVVAVDAEVVAVDVDEDALLAAADRVNNPEDPEGDLDRDDVVPADPIPGLFTVRVRAEDVTRLTVTDSGAELVLAYRDPDAEDTFTAVPAALLDTMCAYPVTFARAVAGQPLLFDEDGTPLVLQAPTAAGQPGELQVLDAVATNDAPFTTRQVAVTPKLTPLGEHETVDVDGSPVLLWNSTPETAGLVAEGGELLYDADGNPTFTVIGDGQPLPLDCLQANTTGPVGDGTTTLEPVTDDEVEADR